jgi:hypothetical protein
MLKHSKTSEMPVGDAVADWRDVSDPDALAAEGFADWPEVHERFDPRSRISNWRAQRDGQFPKSLKVGRRQVWPRVVLKRWAAAQIREQLRGGDAS